METMPAIAGGGGGSDDDDISSGGWSNEYIAIIITALLMLSLLASCFGRLVRMRAYAWVQTTCRSS